MGFINPPDISQLKINGIFQVFNFIRDHIDYLLILNKDDWTDHLEKWISY